MSIPVAGPSITEREIQYVSDAVRTGWYSSANKYTEHFERVFSYYVSRKYAIALPSATSGIHLSLLALGIGKGNEVIVPDLTWIATAAPVTYVGATPVFADVNEKTWCLDPDSFLDRITPKTKAVVPVDLYGGMPDMKAICDIANDKRIAVIEDAAEAIGSEYHGWPAGSFGDTSVFSFHGSKTLTTGEGGMLVTDDKHIYDRCRTLCNHCSSNNGKMFWNTEVGFKYKMGGLQAALGLAQIERIDELVNRKREIFSQYQKHLGQVPEITLNCEPLETKNSYWMTTAVIDRTQKENLISTLKDRGIDTRPFFYPLSSLPAYCNVPCKRNPVAYRISPYGINLPSAMNITDTEIGYVCKMLKEVIGEWTRLR